MAVTVCVSTCAVAEVLKVMNRFYKRKEMQKLAADQGLDGEEHVYIISQFLGHAHLHLAI